MSDFTLTNEQLSQILTGNTFIDQWVEALNKHLPNYNINTVERVADFIGQCAHESNNFKTLNENLNYGAQGLANTWSKRFAELDADGNPIKPIVPSALAKSIERNPEIIANHVYANRLGNGDTDSGDGWRYHGRGLIQLTGKDNYAAFGATVNMSAEEVVDYAQTFDGAVQTACWFWTTHNLNQYSDVSDIETTTKRINGGTLGLDDRIAKCNLAQQVLGA